MLVQVDCGALKAARKVEQAAAEKFKKCCEQDVVSRCGEVFVVFCTEEIVITRVFELDSPRL